MFKIQKLNKISSRGLELLASENYENASEILNPDAILVRSADMHKSDIPASVKAIARAGAGVNNIPVDVCSEKGIVVFNTPGANANAVKELVIMSAILSSRNVFEAISWVQTLKGKGDEIPKMYEAEKSRFTGPEILNKKFGVVGLGAIGVLVANAAVALGMEVIGYDPFLSVDAAWKLSRSVKKAVSLDSLLTECNYVSLHVPLTEETKGLIGREKISIMKKDVIVLNFSRGGLVNNKDMLAALAEKKVKSYVTDFPDDNLLGVDGVIPVPHLGASSPESEENCAVMAVNQLKEYLEFGNITNSVNFPESVLAPTGKTRITLANKNVPNIIGQITNILAQHSINIADMLNKSRGDYAYNIIDTDQAIPEKVTSELLKIEGVIMVRVIV